MRGDRAALHDINLEIARGEHVCILGPNGCGKSTLIKTITRECYPLARDGSRISILGRERWDISSCARCSVLCRRTCWLPAPRTPPAATWYSPVFSVARVYFRIIIRIRSVSPWLTKRWRGLASRILPLARVAEMSSGEAKRTLIARALAHQPQTLLFDEPSNALDIGAQLQLRDTMRELAQSGSESCS